MTTIEGIHQWLGETAALFNQIALMEEICLLLFHCGRNQLYVCFVHHIVFTQNEMESWVKLMKNFIFFFMDASSQGISQRPEHESMRESAIVRYLLREVGEIDVRICW